MNAFAVYLIALQVIVMVILAPIVVGCTRQARAKLEGRVGAGVLQPWRDLRKLMVKEPIRANGKSLVLVGAPLVAVGSGLMLCALFPLIGVQSLSLIPNDLFVVVTVLLIGTAALGLLGLGAGTAFGGMGASRHMMIAALVEPTVLVAIYALSVPVGSSSLSRILLGRLNTPTEIINPAGVLAVVALVIAIVAETGRLPVDNPGTHLELTMVHEAMVLESSGRDLGWLELASWLRMSALLGLVANLLIPWGVATTTSVVALLVGTAAIAVKVLCVGLLLGAVEVFIAKLRLFRVPELLAGSFVLALLAVTTSYLIAPPS